MNELNRKYRKFIIDDPDSYIEYSTLNRNIMIEEDSDNSISQIIIKLYLHELYENYEKESSLNDKLLNICTQELKSKKKKRNSSLDKRIVTLYLNELDSDKDFVTDLDERIATLYRDKYLKDSNYEYKWIDFSKRSFLDVLDAYFFRKRNGIKTQKIYSKFHYDDEDDEITKLMNRSVFEIYKEYFKRLFSFLKNTRIDFGKKSVRID